jgi:hypothetical protein
MESSLLHADEGGPNAARRHQHKLEQQQPSNSFAHLTKPIQSLHPPSPKPVPPLDVSLFHPELLQGSTSSGMGWEQDSTSFSKLIKVHGADSDSSSASNLSFSRLMMAAEYSAKGESI